MTRPGLAAPQPLDRKGLKPADVGPRPEQLWVKVSDLRIDRAYQRTFAARSAALIRRMIEGWDWRLIQAITVAELPGGLWELIDGQHRAVAAATHGGIPLLPATVLPAEGTRAAARAFVDLNTQRVSITPGQTLKAGIAAGEPASVAVWKAAEAARVRLFFSHPPGGGRTDLARACMASSALLAIARRRGEAGLQRVLEACAKAELAPIRQEHLAALEALLLEPDFGGDEIDAAVVAPVLRHWAEIDAAAATLRAERGLPRPRALAVEIHRRLRARREAA